MPYRYLQDVPAPEILARIDAAIELLEAYEGEPIVAHQHPLHNAMVALEQTLRVSYGTPTPKQPSKLPLYLSDTWHHLLWASRGWTRPTGEPWDAQAWQPFVRAKLLRFRELVTSGAWARALSTVRELPAYQGRTMWTHGSVHDLLRAEIKPLGDPPGYRDGE